MVFQGITAYTLHHKVNRVKFFFAGANRTGERRPGRKPRFLNGKSQSLGAADAATKRPFGQDEQDEQDSEVQERELTEARGGPAAKDDRAAEAATEGDG